MKNPIQIIATEFGFVITDKINSTFILNNNSTLIDDPIRVIALCYRRVSQEYKDVFDSTKAKESNIVVNGIEYTYEEIKDGFEIL